MRRPIFIPKTASSLSTITTPSNTPILDRPHSPSQTASESAQPFCHNTFCGQTDRPTDLLSLYITGGFYVRQQELASPASYTRSVVHCSALARRPPWRPLANTSKSTNRKHVIAQLNDMLRRRLFERGVSTVQPPSECF